MYINKTTGRNDIHTNSAKISYKMIEVKANNGLGRIKAWSDWARKQKLHGQ